MKISVEQARGELIAHVWSTRRKIPKNCESFNFFATMAIDILSKFESKFPNKPCKQTGLNVLISKKVTNQLYSLMSGVSEYELGYQALLSSLRGQKPEKVLISYLLAQFSDFETFDIIQRVKVEFCFEIYVQHRITDVQLLGICGGLSKSLLPACEKIIGLNRGPLSMTGVTSSSRWSQDETLNLLLCLKAENVQMLQQVLAHRSLAQCRERVRYVVFCLKQRSVSTENLIQRTEEVPASQISPVKAVSQSNAFWRMKLTREKYNSRIQNSRWQGKCLTLHRRIKQLETKLSELELEAERAQDDSSNESSEASPLFRYHVLSEMVFLSQKQARQRRYSEQLRDICQLVMLTSPRTYRLLQQVLPLPTKEALRFHYSSSFILTKTMISDQILLDHQVGMFCTEIPEKSMITIGMDAFSFRTFKETSTMKTKEDSVFSDAFIFMHVPLDANLATKVLHIQKKGNGSFDSSVLETFKHIAEIYRERQLKVMFMATDGDRYLTSIHEQFFDTYVAPWRDSFALIIERTYEMLMSSDEVMPIADPLHFAKNIRGKLIDHDVVVINADHADQLVFLNSQHLEQCLELGLALTDKSQIGRMRDKYVTDIFTLMNVCTLLEAGEIHSAFLFLPYACVFTLLYALNITTETRLFLANLAYTSFERLLTQAEDIVKTHNNVKYRHRSGVRAITFAEPSYIMRMMHTCLAFGIAIVFGPKNLRLDSIGTHLIENTIGIARSVSNSTDYERILSAFANAQMRKEIANKLGLTLYVSHRVNDGGAKVDTQSATGLRHPNRWDARDIVSLFHEQCIGVSCEDDTEWKAFRGELTAFSRELTIQSLSSPSAVSNALIVERNRQFHANSAPTGQEEPNKPC